MSEKKAAEKAAEFVTTYAICRTDGTDWRDCPEGTTLAQAKEGAFALNRQATVNGILHRGAPAEYEVRIVTREVV